MKTTHAALGLYDRISPLDARGVTVRVCDGPDGDVGDGNLIISSRLYATGRRKRRVRGREERCDTLSSAVTCDHSGCNDDSGSSRTNHHLTDDIQLTNNHPSDYGGGDDSEHVLASSFLSHKNMLYTHDVLRRNSQALRHPYIRTPLPSGRHNSDIDTEPCTEIDTSYVTPDTDGVTNPDAEVSNAICLPLLVDLFPSTAILSHLLMLQPLRNTLCCTQQTAVNILQEKFHLLQHFSFLQSVFLLGEVSAVFAALREQLFADSEGNSSTSVGRYQLQQYHHTNMLRAISDSAMLRISQLLPLNFSESLVSVTFAAGPGDAPTAGNTGSSSADPLLVSSGFSQAERLYSSLDQLMVQIHYPPPLSDVLPPPAVSTYNTLLQFLLKITLSCWVSEKLWKQSTGSGSFLTLLCSTRSRVGASAARTHSSSGSSSGTLRRLHRSCMTGLQWIIYVSRALETFYLHEIHQVQSPQFTAALHSTLRGSSTHSTSGDNVSVSTLAERHEIYLNKVTSCVQFLQPVVLGAIHASVSALGVFEEAHAAAEANKALLLVKEGRGDSVKAQEESDSANIMVQKIICSRLTHAATKMKQAQEQIVSLVDRVESLHRQYQQHQQGLTADDVRHMTAMRSLLGHISNSGGID